MFEGIRGLRFQGDIAIDDVTLSPECFGKGKRVFLEILCRYLLLVGLN